MSQFCTRVVECLFSDSTTMLVINAFLVQSNLMTPPADFVQRWRYCCQRNERQDQMRQHLGQVSRLDTSMIAIVGKQFPPPSFSRLEQAFEGLQPVVRVQLFPSKVYQRRADFGQYTMEHEE